MKSVSNSQLAKIFREISVYLDMKDIPFKPRAYERVAQVLEALEEEASDIYKRGGREALERIPGVGASIAGHMEEIFKHGTLREYQTLKREIPVRLDELLSIEGMGPKKVKILYKKLGIRTRKELEVAAKAGKIRKLQGFGAKSEENILHGIEFVKKESGRLLLGEALPIARQVIEELKELKEVREISEAGSLRRRQETIGDIDILVASASPLKVIERFVGRKDIVKVWGRGPTKASIRIRAGFDIDIRVVPPQSWGSALQYFTGSKSHNIKTRQIAIKKGLKLNEYGVFRGRKQIAGRTEREVYGALHLPYFEPETREDAGEIEYALEKKAMPRLISYGDLRGDLQVQTNWTDGSNSIEEMAREAMRLGLEYIAITDHTKALAMTGGSDEEKLLRQIKEIDRLNKKLQGIIILKGAEVNILKDGSLDIRDDVLARLDVVGISVHSSFKMPKKEMTERIIRAMNNPNADILFHPTGRLIQKRNAYELDMRAIVQTAKDTGTVLEINAHPIRLDLKDEYIRMAVVAGVKLCIDSDAHSSSHFQLLEYGIAQARRGWAEKKDVINTHPLGVMLKMLK